MKKKEKSYNFYRGLGLRLSRKKKLLADKASISPLVKFCVYYLTFMDGRVLANSNIVIPLIEGQKT